MQRGKDQMPGLPRRERDLHRFGIPHLADHNHIGGLPQRGAER